MKRSAAKEIYSLVNPRQAATEVVSSAFGKLSPSDVAAALKGAERIQMEILNAIWGDDEAKKTVRFWFIALTTKKEWKCTFKNKQLIATFAYEEALEKFCETCKNRRTVPNERGILEECRSCVGKMASRNRPIDKADRLGVPERTYFRVWRIREKELLARYDELLSDAVSRLSYNL